jgi:hypothetical protein
VSRLPHALVAALALHGLLFFVRARHSHVALPPREPAPAELVEIEPSVEAAPRPDNAQPAPDAQPASGSASPPQATPLRTGARAATPSAATEARTEGSTDALANDGTDALGVAAPSPVASGDAPAHKIDLGLDGHFFMRPPSEELPRVGKTEIQRQLEASIAADDVKHGLARGNVLLGSLNSAIRDVGPVRGETLVRVTVGADGMLTDVELLRGTVSDWAAALSSFRALASRKHVRVPSGARGLRVTFSVKAKVQLPSGAEIKGPGVASPSLDPDGLVPRVTFDVADIGANPQRLVYAHVVSEEVL